MSDTSKLPIKLISMPEPFSVQERDILYVSPGKSLLRTIEDSSLRFKPGPRLCVFLNGQEVEPKDYARIRPAPGSIVNIVAVPATGDDDVNKLIRTVVIAYVTYATAGLASTSFGGALAAIGATMATNYLLDQFIPPPNMGGFQTGGNQGARQTFGIEGARNQANNWGSVPMLLGTHRFAPPYAAQPYTEIVGDDQYLRLLFCLGYGTIECESMQIGETDISDFMSDGSEGTGTLEYYIHQNYDPYASGAELKLFTGDIYEESLSITLLSADGYTTRTTQENVDEFIVDIQAPQGVFQIVGSTRTYYTVQFEIQYKETGSSAGWTAGEVGLSLGLRQIVLTPPPYAFVCEGAGDCGEESITRWYAIAMKKDDGTLESFGPGTKIFNNLRYPLIPDTHDALAYVSLSSDGTVNSVVDARTATAPQRDIDSSDSEFEVSLSSGTTFNVAAGTLYSTQQFISNEAGAVRRGYRFRVPAQGQYDVRIKKITTDTTSDLVRDTLVWTALRSITRTVPVEMAGTTLVEMRIKATNVLSGVVDTFNVLASNYLPDVFTGSSWSTDMNSSNPADLFRYVLQSPANKRAVTDDQIDLDQVEYWWTYCDTNGFQFDMYLDDRKSVYEVLKLICAAGRASFTYADGLYSVVIDEVKNTIIQHFTPRNSSDFQGQRSYLNLPHAFKVRFPNREKSYHSDERIVYDDGYDENNATIFEELDLPGVTSSELAYKHARYHIAQLRLRPERYTFKADIENLVCTRGDLIRVTHDVPLWGLGTGRIASITEDSTGITHLTLDSVVTMASGSYALRIRQSGGGSIEAQVVLDVGEQTVVELVTPLSDSSDQVAAGDLFMFGVYQSESTKLLIDSISPSEDLSAIITCVDYNAAVYTADTGTIPDFNSNVTVDPGAISPVFDTLQSDEDVLLEVNGMLVPQILITFASVSSRRYDLLDGVMVQYKPLNAYSIFGRWDSPGLQEPHCKYLSLTNVIEQGTYLIRAAYKYKDGSYGPWAFTSHTVVGMSTDPSNVTGLTAHQVNGQLTLFWAPVTDKDLSHYELRYTPTVPASADSSGALITWGAANILIDRIPRGSSTVTTPATAGTYLLKAVDFSGKYSITAAQAIITTAEVTIDKVVVISFTEDGASSAGWPGALTDITEESNGTLMLDTESNGDFLTSGTYEFSNSIDLGYVFGIRVQMSAEVYGSNESNTIDMWDDLSLITDLAGENNEAWRLEYYYRATNDDPATSAAVWGAWTKLTLADIGGRGFEFKAILISEDVAVTPVVTSLSMTASMVSRVEADYDISSGAAPKAITFGNIFYARPAIAITAEDMATGDYFVVTSQSVTGFTVEFKNSAGSSVDRTFDWMASGHGKRIT